IKAAREYAPRLAETLGPTNCFGATPAPKRPGSFPMSSTSQRLGRASMEAVLGRVLCGHAPDLRFLGRRTEQIEHTLGKHFSEFCLAELLLKRKPQQRLRVGHWIDDTSYACGWAYGKNHLQPVRARAGGAP